MTAGARILGWVRGYHAWLVRNAESRDALARSFFIRDLGFYWLCVLFVALPICLLFDPDAFWRTVILIPLGIISFGGMICSYAVVFLAGLKTDRRRLEEWRRGRLVR